MVVVVTFLGVSSPKTDPENLAWVLVGRRSQEAQVKKGK